MTLALRSYLREGVQSQSKDINNTRTRKEADTLLSLGKPKLWSKNFTVVAFFSQHHFLSLLWFRGWSSIAFKFFGKVSVAVPWILYIIQIQT